MACLMCGRGMHSFCKNSPCCCTSSAQEIQSESEVSEDGIRDYQEEKSRVRRGSGKRDESLRDQQSTGRKRAAVKYPLDRSAPCEWQGLLFAGGGEFPIVGCIDGKQQARHHGPDKNTLNNDEGNVHRICHTCHNRWHARNDETYKWGGIYRSHDPNTKASTEEIAKSEISWAGTKLTKVRD